MGTHGEETRKFFKHSSVICVLSPRCARSKLSIFKQKVVGTLFTHHQKCVLVDTQASCNTRKVTAFVGGLDLCDGRYDTPQRYHTPQHRLFKDLDTVFENDFHNPTFSFSTGSDEVFQFSTGSDFPLLSVQFIFSTYIQQEDKAARRRHARSTRLWPGIEPQTLVFYSLCDHASLSRGHPDLMCRKGQQGDNNASFPSSPRTKDPGQEPFAFIIGKGSMIKGGPLCSWARNGSAAHNLRLL